MPRNGDRSRRRLQISALELFSELGYDATTTAQIAARAGVTERTLFRQFLDKREVLFDGEAELCADLRRGVADASAGPDPLAILLDAFCTTVPLLVRNRPLSAPRQKIIAATPALRERALAKEASLIEVLATALRQRGISANRASLAAHIGMAAYGQATATWLDHPEHQLEQLLQNAFDEVRSLAAGS